ncbi:MAG: DUF3109 family protein [Bacteroidota bacterium]
MAETMRIGKYEIDPILFEKGFSKGCGPFACESTCCTAGVYVDLKEKELILSHKEVIKKYMDETQVSDDTRWFDGEIEDDGDYPSGKIVGTEVVNDKCVFLNKFGMCSLQIAGMEEKLGRWALKPFYCVAFPITVDEGVVTFDDFLHQKTTCCSFIDDRETTLVEACKEELEFVLGQTGYAELSVMQKEHISKYPSTK